MHRSDGPWLVEVAAGWAMEDRAIVTCISMFVASLKGGRVMWPSLYH